jgi:hypothetical protein
MDAAGDLAARRARGAAQLERQADWCRELGSPLYAGLLGAAAADCAAGGPSWALIDGHEDAHIGWALALRFAGAVHRLVLEGAAPELARHYASAGGAARGGDDAWPAFRRVLEAHAGRLRALLPAPVQTNEVARSASLLGGFAAVARECALPLRLLEVGASAGLNLRFDRFRYESDGFAWGDPASPVRLRAIFEGGAAPRTPAGIEVVERAGCDAEPIDPPTEEGRHTLRSYVWPDQVERRARLDAALRVAERVPARVERADALEWTARRLAPAPDAATVLYHSIVLGYLGPDGIRRFVQTVRAAGASASARAPLAWLRLEPAPLDDGTFEHRVTLTIWPGGEDRLLATSSPHGIPVRWRTPE